MDEHWDHDPVGAMTLLGWLQYRHSTYRWLMVQYALLRLWMDRDCRYLLSGGILEDFGLDDAAMGAGEIDSYPFC